MRRLNEMLNALRARPGVAAIVALGVAWGLVMHTMGWAQLAHYAQVRAFDSGQPEIDRWHWETNDKAWVDGHFYSVKSPAMPALVTPLYSAITAVGGEKLARSAVDNVERTAQPKWHPHDVVSLENYGFDVERGERVERSVQQGTPIVWALTLFAAVIPAILLLLGVRWVADRLEPGYGTAAAITLGLATILMTFAAEFFSHVISAALGFAAFIVLIRERDRPASLGLVATAGLLTGLAVSFEFQTGLVGVVLFFYALSQRTDLLRRGAAYAAGAIAGTIPTFAFNMWALGDPLELAYGSAIESPGISGHDVIGLNSDGFFGITAPRLDSAIDLLIAGRGLLVLTPVLVMAAIGAVILRRGSHRAEANTILAVAAVYFLYNSGYWLPFGGGTPGPRFMIPALPFIAVGLATAYRRLPAFTLGLAVPSAMFMLIGSLTYPLIGRQGTGSWADQLMDSDLEHTVLTAFGVTNVWLAVAPVLAAVGTAIVLAVRATPETRLSDIRLAVPVVLTWGWVAAIGPAIAEYDLSTLDRGNVSALWLVAAGVLLSLVALATARALEQRSRTSIPQPASEPALGAELAEETS
jgi:hypothetical protein